MCCVASVCGLVLGAEVTTNNCFSRMWAPTCLPKLMLTGAAILACSGSHWRRASLVGTGQAQGKEDLKMGWSLAVSAPVGEGIATAGCSTSTKLCCSASQRLPAEAWCSLEDRWKHGVNRVTAARVEVGAPEGVQL
jgi:hypothetical protein